MRIQFRTIGVVIALIALYFGHLPSANAALAPNVYKMYLNQIDLSIDARAGNGTLLSGTAAGTDYQKWKFEPYYGAYRMRNLARNQCAYVVDIDPSPIHFNYRLRYGPCYGSAAYQWTVDFPDGNAMRFRSVLVNDCIDRDFFQPTEFTLNACMDWEEQLWR